MFFLSLMIRFNLFADRTKSLLYQGSRKAIECSACGDNQQWGVVDNHNDLLRPLPGQMRLDPEGRLCAEAETNKQVQMSDRVVDQGDMETDGAPSSETAGVSSIPRSPGKQLQIDASGKLAIGPSGLSSFNNYKVHWHTVNRKMMTMFWV
jgi:hypothetical protein